jgi:hypothetical protein
MKLAEALLLRAELQKKLASLQARLAKNAVVQDGDKPHEKPDRLLKQAIEVLGKLNQVIAAIHLANLKNKIRDGDSLTEALTKRDILVLYHGILQGVINAATTQPERYGVKEIRWVPTVNVAKLQEEADETAKRLRQQNTGIQEANWLVEVKL